MRKFICDPLYIEAESMKIVKELLGERGFSPQEEEIIRRIIHTTADVEFADNTVVSPEAVQSAERVFSKGSKCRMVVDTQMIAAGLNDSLLERAGAFLECYIDNERIKNISQEEGITRSMASIRHAAVQDRQGIFIIGNAPTALFELLRLVGEGRVQPDLVIGVPVGFVGAAESKEELMETNLPYITVRGRKGGSTVAVAIVHALLKMFTRG